MVQSKAAAMAIPFEQGSDRLTPVDSETRADNTSVYTGARSVRRRAGMWWFSGVGVLVVLVALYGVLSVIWGGRSVCSGSEASGHDTHARQLAGDPCWKEFAERLDEVNRVFDRDALPITEKEVSDSYKFLEEMLTKKFRTELFYSKWMIWVNSLWLDRLLVKKRDDMFPFETDHVFKFQQGTSIVAAAKRAVEIQSILLTQAYGQDAMSRAERAETHDRVYQNLESFWRDMEKGRHGSKAEDPDTQREKGLTLYAPVPSVVEDLVKGLQTSLNVAHPPVGDPRERNTFIREAITYAIISIVYRSKQSLTAVQKVFITCLLSKGMAMSKVK